MHHHYEAPGQTPWKTMLVLGLICFILAGLELQNILQKEAQKNKATQATKPDQLKMSVTKN